MDIATLSTMKNGAKVLIRVMITDKKLLSKNGGGNYLIVDIQDVNGKMSFPVWDYVEQLDEALEVGMIVDIDASLSSWNDIQQLKNAHFHILTEEELIDVDMAQFVPMYDIPKELIEDMEIIIGDMKEPWKTVVMHATGALGHNAERWKAFLECVAAEKHHGNKRGGLFLHTLGVLLNAENTIAIYVTNPYFYDAKEVIIPDRLRAKAIIHDIEKLNEYEYQTSIRRKPGRPLGHIYDGAALIKQINKDAGDILTKEQEEDLIWSILTHHGQYGPAMPETPEEWILHLADMMDSRIVGYLEK